MLGGTLEREGKGKDGRGKKCNGIRKRDRGGRQTVRNSLAGVSFNPLTARGFTQINIIV